MSIYDNKNGRELLTYFFNKYDIRALPNEELIAVFSELFDLEKKSINMFQMAVLKGRIQSVVMKYQIPLKK